MHDLQQKSHDHLSIVTTDTVLSRLQALERRWAGLLSTPDWYVTVMPELEAFASEIHIESDAVQLSCKQALYDFFEHHLVAGDFCLGREVGYFDTQREPIDSIVIHHTSQEPGLTPDRLSAIELMRLYGPYFAKPEGSDASLTGRAVFSGHIRKGQQVFWPYHWIVRSNGNTERLLSDHEVGWHAGNWEINCQSVGIALDDDYEKSKPSDIILQATANLIALHYGQVPISRIFGHREINQQTQCPSKIFLAGMSGHGWKNDLIDRILHDRDQRAA